MPATCQGSSTAVEILVQVPPILTTSDIPHASSTSMESPTESRLKYRGDPRPIQRTSTSDLESGSSELSPSSPSDSSIEDDHRTSWRRSLLDSMQYMRQMGIFILFLGFALLSAIFWHFFLLRRPLVIASELEPLLEQARNCLEEGSSRLCSLNRRRVNEYLPSPLLDLRESWETYLEEKFKEWKACTTAATFLSGFVLCTLQIPDRNYPATRILAYVTFAVAFFCLLVTRGLLPFHLDSKHARDLHYALHFFEHADKEETPAWKISVILSMSSISTWWVLVLSVATFASVFYDDTTITGSPDDVIPLSLWGMIIARALMVALFLASIICLIWMHMTLKRYGDAVKHPYVTLSPAEPELREAGLDVLYQVQASPPALATAEQDITTYTSNERSS
ncbi:hypothetical protein B0H11DRAFT_2069864 [Mycena galericulata]|nr:hypothetical protein B0H11DRAFT_2069864 [Mycena galericulata]